MPAYVSVAHFTLIAVSRAEEECALAVGPAVDHVALIAGVTLKEESSFSLSNVFVELSLISKVLKAWRSNRIGQVLRRERERDRSTVH